MQKVLSYFITPFFFIAFGVCLLIFHPIQWLCFRINGREGLKRAVSVLNWFLMRCTNILGTTYSFDNPHNIPTGIPIILVANHQSMYDIPPIIWHMRKHHPKFVSKQELGNGIPSVSFNLRNGGSVLIDRNDGKMAIKKIAELGSYIETHCKTAVIFPEGSRSRDGKPKPFKPMGLKMLLKKAPSALIVPVSINNSWRLIQFGKFPMGLGTRARFTVHTPIKNNSNLDALIQQIQTTIRTGIENKA